MRDRLFLLHPDFADPAYPKRRFYCWHCALLEGVLVSFPRLLESIDVHRVAWPRPRQALVDLLGEGTNRSQSLSYRAMLQIVPTSGPLTAFASSSTRTRSFATFRCGMEFQSRTRDAVGLVAFVGATCETQT